MVWWPPYLQECNRKLYLIFEIAQKFLISGLCHYYYSYLNPNVFVVVLSWSFKMLLFSEVIFLMANFIFFLEKKYLFCFFRGEFFKEENNYYSKFIENSLFLKCNHFIYETIMFWTNSGK